MTAQKTKLDDIEDMVSSIHPNDLNDIVDSSVSSSSHSEREEKLCEGQAPGVDLAK